ncbi:MAG: enoyl-CoA hydratase/isomerase family protein [Acidilobus sp.]
MTVRVERSGDVSWVIIDRQEVGNSLGLKDMIEVRGAIEGECVSGDTVVVAITGAGEKFFMGGVDLKETASIQTPDEAWRLMYEGLGGVCRAVFSCRKPIIAAVNGYALGAGMEIIHASDLAYAVRWARLGLPPVKYGMVPPASPTIGVLLSNPKLMAYMVLTGEMITAEEAMRYGLVNDVVDSVEALRAKVEEVASKIAANEPEAVYAARALMAESKVQWLSDKGLRTLAAFTARPVVRKRIEELLLNRRSNRAGASQA